ncbi:MAG: multiprotein bridging factor aMBF1 [Candidatus Bathyarchaeia archaeon]
MECEVCGRRIIGKAHRAVIAGARLMVCQECAQLSSSRWQATPKPRPIRARAAPRRRPPTVRRQRRPIVPEELELVGDYSQRIRRAREESGLTHEELGRRIGERVSVLRKLETGKMVPDEALAKRLEHALKVKLFVPPSPYQGDEEVLARRPSELTLGDVVTVKKKK